MSTENPIPLSTEDLRSFLTDQLLKKNGQSHATPLSSAQHRLWFLDQFEPNTPLYNIPSVAELNGPLNISALEQSLNAIVDRHEILRTRFIDNDGEPGQIIDEEPAIEVQHHDLTSLAGGEQKAEARRLIQQDVKRPFNLSRDRLFRATLIRLAAQEHLLILNMHHIVSDEWSFKVFYSELTALYTGLVRGEKIVLPPLAIQYSDYAAWQREWLKSDAFQQQLAFWKEQLDDNPPAVELPTDRPRPSRPSLKGAVLTRPLSQSLSEGLRQLAQQEGVTLFMLLLAGFKALLYRYTQQQDIIVGSPIAGRNRVETEELIGFFVNTVALRSRLSGQLTFTDLLKQVREVALSAYSHQELPFEKVVEALHPERTTRTPFVSVLFLTQQEMETVEFAGLKTRFCDIGTETAKFELSLGVQEDGPRLISGVEYDTDLFDQETIVRFLQHYESLLQGVVAHPGQKISELPLLSEAERRQLVGEWNDAPARPARFASIPSWFEDQVERTPDAAAVRYEKDSLTYSELNARANQLAHYLRRRGVGPEVPVALHLERSLDMVVAILGVLKAGGAYVPMDPTCPKERLAFMLNDTKAPVILTQQKLRDEFPNAVPLDQEWETISAESPENPSPVLVGENPAYIIYTSGSTGMPKGVLVTHHNVIRLLEQTEPWYGFNSRDVWTLFHSYTFDFSVWELWGALLYGGRLVIVPYLVSRSPREFYELLIKEKVTVLNQTPSAFRQLLWAEAESRPAEAPGLQDTAVVEATDALSLRFVIFGGEALELQSLKPWFERHGDHRPQLVNMYGITETTVHVTYRVIRCCDLVENLGSVIGVPIPDLRIYLLDENLQPVPKGVPGEICVAGAGVARGYLNRPELTAQRFLADPFSTKPGVRLYRSGDLARYTAQGELEYLGRMDDQVKIRGFRVELGEIESALNGHPHIRESVVLAGNGPAGTKRLLAYIIPSGVITLSEVRSYLAQKLPDYMVPSILIPLEALPLTVNGKVDRRALPAPETDQTGSSQSCVAPRNSTETTLVEIWCQLLGRKSVSVDENFFHLGGHSLLATQVISRVAGALNVDLPVRAIFEAPTVAELAEIVGRAQPRALANIGRRERPGEGRDLVSRLGRLSNAQLEQLLQNITESDL